MSRKALIVYSLVAACGVCVFAAALVWQGLPPALESHFGGSQRAEPGAPHSGSPRDKQHQLKESTTGALQFKSEAYNLFGAADSADKFRALQAAFEGLLSDDRIERLHKVDVLTEMLHESEGYQALYVFDYLSHLGPIERTEDLIQTFRQSKNVALRSRILVSLREVLVTDASSDAPTARPRTDLSSDQQTVIDFMRTLALAREGELSKYTVLQVTPLLPQDVQEEIVVALNPASMEALSISSHEFCGLLFDLAVANTDERSLARFLAAVDANNLLRDLELRERVLVTLEQTNGDPRLSSFSAEVRKRIGDSR
jgi:hypothetical protein